jgi:hypothetical protein
MPLELQAKLLLPLWRRISAPPVVLASQALTYVDGALDSGAEIAPDLLSDGGARLQRSLRAIDTVPCNAGALAAGYADHFGFPAPVLECYWRGAAVLAE